jgi:hypothetical protein
VTDPTARAVAGAGVVITNINTNIQRSVLTNSTGIYDAPALPPGTYSVKVNMPGFKTEIRSDLVLQVDQVARLDFALQVGNVSETVEVQAEAPTLDTETATIGTVVETKRIEELPLNGRNYLQLASLVPGATAYGPGNSIAQARGGGDRSNFQLNLAGQRLENNHYSLDGIENTDPNYGTYLVQPSVDALQEFKVETSTYTAEYGHNLAQINVITRAAAMSITAPSSSSSATPIWMRKTSSPNRRCQPPLQAQSVWRRDQRTSSNPEGCEQQNKLFFFFNYEGHDRSKPDLVSTIPFESDRAGIMPVRARSSTTRPPASCPGWVRVVSVDPFPNNQIPPDTIHPVSTALLKYYPLPEQHQQRLRQRFRQ